MQTVSWAGSSYNIPNQRGDTPWSGLSDFAIAVAAKGINTNGGAFTLLADINFGATFGLVSTYFKSRTASIATAGILRLASTDTIQWKNNAGSGNVSLSKNTNNELLWNGSRIILAGGGLIVNADISASAAIAFSKLASLTNTHILVGSAGGVATDVALSGDATLAASGALTLATVNSNVGSFTNSSITVNAKGLVTAASSGSASVTSVSGTANQITSTGGTTPVLALASPLTTPGAVTVTGSITFTPTTAGIVGTTTSDDAASGNVGQNITAGLARAGSSLTNNTALNIVSISVPAGDWDIRAMIGVAPSGTTNITAVEAGISLTSATLPAASTRSNPTAGGEVATITGYPATYVPTNDIDYAIPPVRISRANTATYYLVISASFTVSTLSAYGFLSARRVR